MFILGIIVIILALSLLYLKYRVVFTGEKCKGKIIDIKDINTGYVIRGFTVKKHSYIVRIKNKNYTTAHGCIFLSFGKRKIGNEITVFKNDKYGKEVFKAFDFRIELIAFLIILFGILLIHESF